MGHHMETAQANEKGQWKPGQSGNPGGRPKRIGLVRDLLQPRQAELVKKAVDLALAGDVAALRLCMERLSPPLRASSEPVVIAGLAEANTLTDRCEVIVRAVGSGVISPTVGGELLAAMGNLAKAMETDELARRITALEKEGKA